MTRTIKLRIYPNKTQESIINQTLGACRFVYNKYIEFSRKRYEETGEFLHGYEFGKELNKLKKIDERFMWIDGLSSKAIKNSIMNAHKIYLKFFNGKIPRPPWFKNKKNPIQSYYFISNPVKITGNRIFIPKLKDVRITEKITLPNNIISGRVIKSHNKYYVSIAYEKDINTDYEDNEINHGMGIDIGTKIYATIYTKDADNNPKIFKKSNFNKSKEVLRLEERIKMFNRIISNKVEINTKKLKERGIINDENTNEETKKYYERRSYYTSNIKRIRKKIIRLNERLNNIRKDNIDKLCYSLVIAKPEYITIEDLSISNMLQEGQTKLADNIQKCKFFYFRRQLTFKCEEYNIELRVADKYYASSKLCSCCGNKKKDLSLSDRIYVCTNCGVKIDRDINASINLYNLEKYMIQ